MILYVFNLITLLRYILIWPFCVNLPGAKFVFSVSRFIYFLTSQKFSWIVFLNICILWFRYFRKWKHCLLCLTFISFIFLIQFNSLFQFGYAAFIIFMLNFLSMFPAVSLFSFPHSNFNSISGVFSIVFRFCFKLYISIFHLLLLHHCVFPKFFFFYNFYWEKIHVT